MPRLDDLPPDLRATLSLLVDRGKSYAQVADLLDIPESAVRDRAHAALDALAGSPEQAGGPAAVPPAPPPGGATYAPSPRSGRTAARTSPPPRRPGSSATAPALPVSRRGGALLLSALVIIVIVVVLLTSGGGGSNKNAGAGTSASTKKSGASKPTITKQLTLSPPDPSSKSIGLVEVLAEGSQRAFYIAAERLPPSQGFFYAVWLYNSPSRAEAISKSPKVGSDGRLQGGALLPANAGSYHKILLTRETSQRPTRPGPTVLSGPFSLG
jgi:Sigma-70, region 4